MKGATGTFHQDNPDFPSIPVFENENFRIASTGWFERADTDGIRYLENPEGDVWELLEGPFAGEQHFTLIAAIRETAKAGKRIPTNEEWENVLTSKNCFYPPLAGVRRGEDGRYRFQGSYGSYWASLSRSELGSYVVEFFRSGRKKIATDDSRKNGSSIRCLVN